MLFYFLVCVRINKVFWNKLILKLLEFCKGLIFCLSNVKMLMGKLILIFLIFIVESLLLVGVGVKGLNLYYFRLLIFFLDFVILEMFISEWFFMLSILFVYIWNGD